MNLDHLPDDMLLEICRNADEYTLNSMIRSSTRTRRICSTVLQQRKTKFLWDRWLIDNEVIMPKLTYDYLSANNIQPDDRFDQDKFTIIFGFDAEVDEDLNEPDEFAFDRVYYFSNTKKSSDTADTITWQVVKLHMQKQIDDLIYLAYNADINTLAAHVKNLAATPTLYVVPYQVDNQIELRVKRSPYNIFVVNILQQVDAFYDLMDKEDFRRYGLDLNKGDILPVSTFEEWKPQYMIDKILADLQARI